MTFKLTGFTDEASSQLEVQIAITQELGWHYLSARTMGDKNIHEISEDAFETVVDQIQESGIQIAEFGTLIGNWSKSIKSDWSITLAEINRCIPRMQRLDVRFARIMSYAQEPWGDDQMEAERFKRVKNIHSLFADAGITALHENCMNWGGFSAEHTLRLLDEIPELKLVFDTGNPIFQRDRSKKAPHPWQNSLDFYHQVKDAIAHVHIKDAIMRPDDEEPQYTFPGEGAGHVIEIMQDLKKRNYQGFIAIEPHMGKVFHNSDRDDKKINQYDIYLQYGHRMEQLIEKL
jgi:sugar phosphate isomerase/epimerase